MEMGIFFGGGGWGVGGNRVAVSFNSDREFLLV